MINGKQILHLHVQNTEKVGNFASHKGVLASKSFQL